MGIGVLIIVVMGCGVEKIILGFGGSVINDVGMGMVVVLGYCFLDRQGYELELVGENFVKVYCIDDCMLFLDLWQIEIIILCDVDNLFFGEYGVVWVFVFQKGVDQVVVELLDVGLWYIVL